MATISALSLVRNDQEASVDEQRTVAQLAAHVRERAESLIAFAQQRADGETSFAAFEKALIPLLFALARATVAVFLQAAEERLSSTLPARVEKAGRVFRLAPVQWRNLMTWFGVVRYARTYMREVAVEHPHGFHPLDAQLGLSADRFSSNVLSCVVRLATRTTFAGACEVMRWFVPAVPSTEAVEAALLGYGRHTHAWFQSAPPPEGDGEVLIVMVDSKGAPTATDEEMRKRRGKRKKKERAPSPRHRGRKQRQGWSKKRRKKGDKAKNAKMATMVVMYTLARHPSGLLLGPINKRYYASFANKRHACEFARAEATKRGFPPETRKLVQVVTDGDNDLARYLAELFPQAVRTIDVVHVVEKLWDVATCLHREGSLEAAVWAERQKDALYGGRVADVIAELQRQLAARPKTGPGNKWRREQIEKVLTYIEKRQASMNYDELMAQDLELGSGPVEGAIKNIIGQRMDHGGMRWIKERAEAVLQLRCIDRNGDWDAFIRHVHETIQREASQSGRRPKLQQRQPAALPEVHEEAA